VDLPDLTPQDAALLAQFRVDETPSDDVIDRVHRRLHARLSSADAPMSLLSRWSMWLRAGGLTLAIASAVLLVLAGGSRLLGRLSAPARSSEASDTVQQGAPAELASPPAPPQPTPEIALPPAPPASEPPSSSEPAALPSATAALEPTRGRGPVRAKSGAPIAAPPIDAAAEIALVSSARLERDPNARLELIARHHREFAGGKLVQEIAILEIQTLCAIGRRDDGRAQAAVFTQRHPGSAYAAIASRACPESGR
jgi:hypothetical protein